MQGEEFLRGKTLGVIPEAKSGMRKMRDLRHTTPISILVLLVGPLKIIPNPLAMEEVSETVSEMAPIPGMGVRGMNGQIITLAFAVLSWYLEVVMLSMGAKGRVGRGDHLEVSIHQDLQWRVPYLMNPDLSDALFFSIARTFQFPFLCICKQTTIPAPKRIQ